LIFEKNGIENLSHGDLMGDLLGNLLGISWGSHGNLMGISWGSHGDLSLGGIS